MDTVVVKRNALERAIVVVCSILLWLTTVVIFVILTANTVLRYLDDIFAHLWEFRFFYCDVNSLLREVPGLKERYRDLAERVRIRSRAIFDSMVAAGWMDASPEQLDLLTTNAWIVLTQWFTHRQVVDRRRTIQSSDIREGIRHFVALFSPLLRSPQRKLVERMTARPAG